MSPVRIVGDVGYVAVPATAALVPRLIKLNALEAQWLIFPALQHVQLFEGDDLPPFHEVLASLRSSLAETLAASFAPLAGKLVHLADTGDVAISCVSSSSSSDGGGGGGVMFVVAESDADVHRLATDEEHDVEALERLAPELDMGVLPTPVLAVKATRFKAGGGVALGVTAHHAVADGRSLWRFMEAWAAACRGETGTPATDAPSFDRSLVKMPAGGEELARTVLRKVAPNLPVAIPPTSMQDDRARFSRRTFTLDAREIQRLKRRIVHLSGAEAHGHGEPQRRRLPLPSTFAAVAALAWASFAQCKPFAEEEDVAVFFFADLRDRLLDPPAAGYFGAYLTACAARLRERELRSERALAAAAAAVQGEVRRLEEDPLARWDFTGMARTLPLDRLLNVTWSPAFRPYEVADFGWGKPRRTEPVGMKHDGQVTLMRAMDGHGVQVTASLLQSAHMDEFKSRFFKLLA